MPDARSILVLGLPAGLVLGLFALLPGAPADATSRTCFGEEPTIVRTGYVVGTEGDDVILADAGSEVHALGGHDRVCGAGLVHAGAGRDRVWYDGGGADLLLDGGPGADRLFYLGGELAELTGGRGDDHLRSGPGRQYLTGGPGDDDLGSGRGADHLSGGAGNDRIDGGAGRDAAGGGPGRDRCRNVEDATACER
ncbi:calcium-binding protein [Nocardioides sp. GCM10027113]|uniref:calcium-binding protein n=1 Tax=unclassified Nocardioides TaxID=2615069 RepID=UPI0036177774